jgi:hypothetical protein
MMKSEDLLFHAARCDALAGTCSDLTVAGKLRQLARDYRSMVTPERADIGVLAAIQAYRSRLATA